MSRNTSRVESDARAAPSGSEPTVTLGALKDLLHRFTWERRDWDREKAAAEFGALVLYVI